MHVTLVTRCTFALTLYAVAIASAAAGELLIPPPVPPDIWWAPPPRFSWTGCHVGAHIGGGFGEDKFKAVAALQNQSIPAFAFNDNSVSFGESGMLAGAQAGCDLQLAPNWVIGIDGDASGGNISGSNNTPARSAAITVWPATVSSSGNLSVKTNFLSTVTGRLGYSFERGRGLIYAKAGAALVNNSYNFGGQVTVSNPPTASSFNFNASEMRMRTGWSVGAGVEWAILNNWSVKLEYDYLDFGSYNLQLANSGSGSGTISVNQRISEVKLGVNYLLGW